MIDPRQVADALVAAERERKPIAPFTDMYPFLDAGRAYQAQRLFVEDHLNGGGCGSAAPRESAESLERCRVLS